LRAAGDFVSEATILERKVSIHGSYMLRIEVRLQIRRAQIKLEPYFEVVAWFIVKKIRTDLIWLKICAIQHFQNRSEATLKRPFKIATTGNHRVGRLTQPACIAVRELVSYLVHMGSLLQLCSCCVGRPGDNLLAGSRRQAGKSGRELAVDGVQLAVRDG
jgi:hypothetical protein